MVNWITVSSSSGNSGSTVVTVTASSYTELTARTTSLTVRTVNSNLSKNVNITQEPKEIITVTVSPTSISAPVSGGTYTFNIASNGAWTITYPSWLQVSQTSGTGNATITVTIPENESYSALTGNIVVSTADNTATVSVSQAAEEEPSRISVSPTTIQNISSGGSAYTLTITSNTEWRLTDGPSWVRFNATSGSGNTTIVITVVPNSGSARTDNIVFTTTDSAATATVSLSQDAYSEQPDYSTEYLTFEIISGGSFYWKSGDSIKSERTIEYSKNNDSWTSVTSSSGGNGTLITTVSAGDKVRLKANFDSNTDVIDNTASDLSRHCYFVSTAYFNVYGNLASLHYGENGLTTVATPPICYKLFQDCSYLISAKNMYIGGTTAQTLEGMFYNCSNLTDVPALPQTTLTGVCYAYMFYSCSSLTTAPELPATTLAGGCYSSMFRGCTSLTAAPALPATTLASGCYSYMFQGCTSLTTAPALPATTLANECYSEMFSGCTSLTTAPALPATTLAYRCYASMFQGCTNLTTAPALPVTTLATSCYEYMFYGCTNLTTAPALPATTLVFSCYNRMFNSCSRLGFIKCLATDISATDCTYNWVDGVASTGTFVKNPSMTSWTTGVSGIPNGWTVQDAS